MILEIWAGIWIVALALTSLSFIYEESGILCFITMIIWVALAYSSTQLEINTVPYPLVSSINYVSIIPLIYLLYALGLVQGIRGLIMVMNPEKQYKTDEGDVYEPI